MDCLDWGKEQKLFFKKIKKIICFPFGLHLSLFSSLDSDIKYVHHISRTLSAVLQSVAMQLE